MNNSSRKTLATNLLRLREKKKISIEEIAFVCSISSRHFGDIERAKCNTTLDTLDKISKGTAVSVVDLLTDNSKGKEH